MCIRDRPQSLVRRRYSRAASGTHASRMRSDQTTEASTGCCIGQAWIEAEGFGLPHRVLQAEATALTGFQLAIVASHAGIPWVGTKTLETKASGNTRMKTMPWAVSALETAIPTLALSHE